MYRRKLCCSALAVLLLAGGIYAKRQKPPDTTQQQRAVHALDRLTFGPRPGDVQAVTAMGVDKWIDLQLHPEKIDNSAMQARLAPYRTLYMSSRDVVLAFPPNPVAKDAMDGKLPIPRDRYEHAIYVAAIDRVQQKQERKQEPAPPPAAPTSAAPTMQPTDLSQRQALTRESHNVVDDLVVLSPDQRMNRILDLTVAQQHDLLQGIRYEKRQALLAGLSPEQRETVIALNHPEAVVDQEVQAAKLLRAVYSDRQLEEVLTDFWFNHFNVFIGKGADRYLVTGYERDVIRPHVLGKFQDLLLATAQSPAMLFYLDNWQSEGPDSAAALGLPVRPNGPGGSHPGSRRPGGPNPPSSQPRPQPNAQNNQQKRRNGLNENYARELMELHTLGVNGGYTQKDVTELARVFTGWTLEQPQQGGGFVYRPRLHEPGDKVVLGHHIKENGEAEGIDVLKLLARQPATARFISTELAQRFVSDNPPPTLINAMAKTFLKKDGDLREVMRTMFRSPEFWAPETYDARVKTPFEFVVSSLRATDTDINDPQPLLGQLNRMGEPLYGMQPPTGYSTKTDVWVNSAALLDRMNFGLALTTNRIQGTHFELARLMNANEGGSGSANGSAVPPSNKLLQAVPSGQGATVAANDTSTEGPDPYQVQLQLEQMLLAGNVTKQTHDTIEQRIVGPALTAEGQDPKHPPNINVIAGLLLGSPEFQRK
jgi:uncharacterized protein (DUF1800 family)